MSVKTMSEFDPTQITRLGFDDDLKAHRMVVVANIDVPPVGSIASLGFESQLEKLANIVQPKVEKIEVPTIIKEIEIKEITKQIVVKELEIKEVQVPVIVKEFEIVRVEVPVIMKQIEQQIVEKPLVIYKTEYKDLPKWMIVCIAAQIIVSILTLLKK